MKIHITRNLLVDDLNKRFQGVYPYLKIHFFRSGQKKTERSNRVIKGVCLHDIAPWMKEGIITIKGTMKVRELEDLFITFFLLKVQVMRRSGNIWLETTATDDWTLAHQNEHGEEITQMSNPAELDENDIELQRNDD